MDATLQLVLSNSLIATLLALVAWGAGRLRANPAAVHLLWLLAVAKLVAPPIASIGVPLPSLVEIDDPTVVASAAESTAAEAFPLVSISEASSLRELPWREALLGLWVAGSAFLLGRVLLRFVGARRLLANAKEAPTFLQEMAQENSRRLRLSRCPELLVSPARMTPAVWSLGWRPRVVFPEALVGEMDRDRLETLLVHELAHVRRRDHLVRLFELAASALFWWHPVVWWARTQLREMEERCCDRIVLRTLPHGPRAYATALVETLDFLSVRPGPLPIGATAASPTVGLMRRIEMLKYDADRPFSLGAVLLGTAIFLPGVTLALADEPKQEGGLTLVVKRRYADVETAHAKAAAIREKIAEAKTPESDDAPSVTVTEDAELVIEAIGEDEAAILEAIDFLPAAPKLKGLQKTGEGVGPGVRKTIKFRSKKGGEEGDAGEGPKPKVLYLKKLGDDGRERVLRLDGVDGGELEGAQMLFLQEGLEGLEGALEMGLEKGVRRRVLILDGEGAVDSEGALRLYLHEEGPEADDPQPKKNVKEEKK